MSNDGLKKARELTDEGFYYDNLLKMARLCREKTHPDSLLSAFVLNRFLSQLAEELGDGPVIVSELRKFEAKYRTALNLALEKAITRSPQLEQDKRCTELVRLLWNE